MLVESKKNGMIPNGTWLRSTTCMFLDRPPNKGEVELDVSEMGCACT